jgi:hypothetical protein
MSETGQVAAFGSDFFPEGHEVIPRPTISETDAIARAAAALGTTPVADAPQTAVLWLVPAPQGELMELTPAYVTVFSANEPFGTWESIVDARSGNILARRNLSVPINVTGTVEGPVQNQPPSHSYCDPNVTEGLKHLTVSVQGGNSDDSDRNGDFDISHGGTTPVTIEGELRGPYIVTNYFLGGNASASASATPGVPSTLTFDGSNSRQDERDVFQHGNIVRDFMFDLDNTFTNLDPTTAHVGRTDGFCPGNAWWNLGQQTMNFCEGSSQYGNTGEMGNVIYHEYGHGITEKSYQRNGAPYPSTDVGEGNSDVVANFIDRNSIIGLGFFLNNCTSGIRDADNNLQWPQDNDGGHFGGQIIAGFHWDAWQSLLGTYSQEVADSVAWNTWHYGREAGTPSNQPAQVLWTFMADDDDGDLTNGTPNYDHFCLGASNHGFECPEILSGVVISHTPLGHTTNGGLGFDVVATITSTESSVDTSQLLVWYRVDGGSYASILMTSALLPDQYTAHIPAQSQDGELDYYIFAADMSGNTRTHPPLAPSEVHSFDVASVYDDLESGTSDWTIGAPGDNATTGIRENVDPIGTAAQPGDDSTTDPGVLCFVTGQCSGPNCGGGCTLGCNDVDDGTTTLLSPVYNLTGASQAKVKYDRWYSNNTGADPNNDNWVVDVSNDGGSSWTNFENTTVSNASWTTFSVDIAALFGSPGMVQLRFRASDLASGSLVEAAVDEIRVLRQDGATDAPDLAAATPLKLALEQNQPNPFRPETRISYALPSRSEVELTVYNVGGQAVRTLVNGVKPAGHYDVRWDGRDSAGQRVSAGVYFYRLEAGAETMTKKMTVLK